MGPCKIAPTPSRQMATDGRSRQQVVSPRRHMRTDPPHPPGIRATPFACRTSARGQACPCVALGIDATAAASPVPIRLASGNRLAILTVLAIAAVVAVILILQRFLA